MTVKAIVLVAGFGTRMKEYTKDLPKPMLPLGDKPMLEYTIRQLAAHGIKEIALNLHYQADKIYNFFKDGKDFGVSITYIREDAPSGTAGGVKKFESFCQDAKNIIVIYGDIITDLNYSNFIAAHNENKSLATICLHRRMKSNSIAEFNSSMQITNFIERPNEEILAKYADGFWVNSAIYCFKPEILNYINPDIPQDFPADIFPQIISKKQLFAYKLDATRYAIDSEEKYLEAKANIENFKFSF